MTGPYAILASRIRQDVVDLERLVERVERAAQSAREGVESDFAVDSAALNLHDFYTGLERVFAQIASAVDTSVPSGPDWYRALLGQMTLAVPGGRPQVLPITLAHDVDELLRFRHVVRHVYAFSLEPGRIARLAERLCPMWVEIEAALVVFAGYLDELATNA